MHFIYYHKKINSDESRFNLFGLLTNSTQRICLVARAGLELVTFRSQSRRFPSTPHMSTNIHVYSTMILVNAGMGNKFSTFRVRYCPCLHLLVNMGLMI